MEFSTRGQRKIAILCIRCMALCACVLLLISSNLVTQLARGTGIMFEIMHYDLWYAMIALGFASYGVFTTQLNRIGYVYLFVVGVVVLNCGAVLLYSFIPLSATTRVSLLSALVLLFLNILAYLHALLVEGLSRQPAS